MTELSRNEAYLASVSSLDDQGAQGDGERPQPAAPAARCSGGLARSRGGVARQDLSPLQPKVKGSRVPPLSSTQTDFVSR
jgi:hypothetical protein